MNGRAPRLALLLVVAAGLGACSSANPRGAPSGQLDVAARLDLPVTVAREGDLATVEFRITNNTANYIILRDLTYMANPNLNELASAAATWQYAQEGKITYNADANEWKYERRNSDPPERRGQTAPLFNSGLLVPTEAITVRLRIRLLGFPKFFQLLYFELPFEKIRSDVYFEAHENREIRYRAQIGNALRSLLVPDPRTEVMDHRKVLYPFAERIEPSAKIKPLKLEAELKPRPFSLADALKKSGGGAAEQYSYSSSLEAWILKRGAEFSMVTPAGVTSLPFLLQMDRTFFFVDSQGVGKIEIELENDAVASVMQLEKKYPIVPSKKAGRTRYFIFLPSADLLRFFADARSARMALDVEMTPDGGGRLRLLELKNP